MSDKDKIDRILAQHERQTAILESARHTRDARASIFAAIDALGGLDEGGSTPGGALRGALPEISRALYVLRRMKGDCNRAIANIARRSKP